MRNCHGARRSKSTKIGRGDGGASAWGEGKRRGKGARLDAGDLRVSGNKDVAFKGPPSGSPHCSDQPVKNTAKLVFNCVLGEQRGVYHPAAGAICTILLCVRGGAAYSSRRGA